MSAIRLNIFFVTIILVFLAGSYWYFKETRQEPPQSQIIAREEINITIIPGWNLRQIAGDWVKKGIVKSEDDLYNLLGKPAYNYKAAGEEAPVLNFADASGTPMFPLILDKPHNVSYEGFIYPDTYRVYADARPEEVLKKIFDNLEKKLTPELRSEIDGQGKSFYEILTMASIIEKEAPTKTDMAKVADIFWRRYEKNWALQSCATVNYITGKNDPGVMNDDKEIDSLFNTYKYPGLPLGAISNPGPEAIRAAIYPEKNNYWYFMSGSDGVTRYAKTLEEHNANVAKYLE